ncbi:hypothetical protein EW145_g5009 [Phellinidium pouzarii]|uniref:Uncharacterized protein n=1 Tax=Phellinidium pouzarii TaxID=167371 RepID=A0A4S4L3E2_9AGAM|nr:hypothetical protein EW145_g5009 [Phellinidium pouzarii]
MTTSLTIDDSSLDIIYSSDWAKQSNDDPNADLFFQSTYHSAQADCASVNLTFTGSAVYLYGTKGPEHANYSVQFDNTTVLHSARANETKYQEPLFTFIFNTSGTHFVSFTSHFVPEGQWLDLDYISITTNGTESAPLPAASSVSPSKSPTISPPWLNSMPSSALSTSRLTLILSIVFGVILAIVFLIALAFVLLRRNRGRLRAEADDASAFAYKPTPMPALPRLSRLSALRPAPARAAPDTYDAQSPVSRTDPFHRDPTPDIHNQDGRRSPWSMFSQGGATVLTTVSTTHLLNSSAVKIAQTQPQTEAKTATEEPVVQQITNPIQNPQTKQVGTQPVSVVNLPLAPLRANHSTSTLGAAAQPAEQPKRPKRSGEGLLDWFGNGIGLERSGSVKRRRDDADSERTNFLQV